MCFKQEKAGHIDASMKLCLSNNTCIALHNLLYHPN